MIVTNPSRKAASQPGVNRQKKRPTIGFFNIEIGNDWASWSWLGLVDAARKHDVNLITFPGAPVALEQANFQANIIYDLAKDSRLDGLIIWKAGLVMTLSEAEIQAFCQQYGVPVVTIEGQLSGSPCVSYENYQGLRAATEHLIEVHGYRKIGFLGMYEHHTGFQERYRGYKDAMKAHDLPIEPELVRPWFPPEQISQAKIKEPILNQYLDTALNLGVEAIIGIADPISNQTQAKLQERGIRVPAEVAIVGFDDAYESHILTPPVTTVKAPFYELGYTAAETLLNVLAGQTAPEFVSVPATLMVRQSCGCKDAYVTAVAAPPDQVLPALPTDDPLNHPDFVPVMTEALQSTLDQQWQPQLQTLLETLVAELTGKNPGAFLNALEDFLLQSTATEDKLSDWHSLISALRRQILLRFKPGNAYLPQVETLFQQAQVLISRVAERTQMLRSFRADQRNNTFQAVGLSLITTLDVATLMDALAAKLPGQDIPGCYVSLYENPKPYRYPNPAPEWAHLILAYNPQERFSLPPGGKRFSARQLIPTEFWPEDRACSFVLLPLHFQQEQIGFILFESAARKGRVYETLGTQISSALKGALLVQQEEKRARQLQTLTEVSTVTSTILETAELLQQVVDLTKIRFNLYHAHIYLLDEANNSLNLVVGAGEAGRQMVAEGWHIALTQEQSLVARAARTRQVVLADNVRTAKDWLPNPLLPNTYAEMAVPIILEDKVMGVLDVQSDKIGGLHETDAHLMRSLANHVAVTLNNARLFEQTVHSHEAAQQAKAEAEQARKEIEIANRQLETQIWHTTGLAQLNDKMRGEQDVPTLANSIVEQLCQYLGCQVGALYLAEGHHLKLAGAYAYDQAPSAAGFAFGQGLVGQAAQSRRPMSLTTVPDNYITIRSSWGEIRLQAVAATPFLLDDRVVGVVELGTLHEFTPTQTSFLQAALNSIAIVFSTALARTRIDELLVETQQQAEELQIQGEELRVANEELESQTHSLRLSETQLKEKQLTLDRQNQELTTAQQELETRAAELALASKYKSEFLANMSHELRTPLNSLLILARMFKDNTEGNLTEEQIESAQIIYSGGQDLLQLINDILDLSKVESGKMVFNFEEMSLTELPTALQYQFSQLALDKGVALEIELAEGLPDAIITDPQRIKQIIINMLSNAFKFTSQGFVRLSIYRPDAGVDLSRSGLTPAQSIAISVTDTGIGMTPEQQKIIFEAFQQADGSTSRQYGGTGLGLSISRELAIRLGGQISVESVLNQGSTFTLYLPLQQQTPEQQPKEAKKPAKRSPQPVPTPAMPASSPAVVAVNDQPRRSSDTKILLIIEDDLKFATVVQGYARQRALGCLIASDGKSGLAMVKSHQPQAIILDLNLPDMSGWDVLQTLKNNPTTRHIPVHIISADDEVLDAYRQGAMGYLTKPVTEEELAASFQKIESIIAKEIKTLLLVEDDRALRHSVKKLLGGNDVQIIEAELGQTALDLLHTQHFDCMILDLSLPDMSGFEVLNKMNGSAQCPVIIYTGRELTAEENRELTKYANSVIVKGVKSPERLLDETALFLHRVVAEMPTEKQQTIQQLYQKDGVLAGKKVLVVDDDVRNSFALSKLLADKGLVVKIAQNGQKALDMLAQDSNVDLVLMDIMMPVLDGYETTKQIRSQAKFKNLPILALTAKAMKGDREKCLAAGANDYLPKPIDIDQLFSMLQVWLYQ